MGHLFFRESAPGQKECADGLRQVNLRLQDLEQECLNSELARQQQQQSASSMQLSGAGKAAAAAHTDEQLRRLGEAAACIRDCVPRVEAAARDAPEHLGHSVVQLVSLLHSLADSGSGAVRAMPREDAGFAQELSVVGAQCRTVLEASGQLLQAVKEAGGNPAAVANTHSQVRETAAGTLDVVEDVHGSVQELLAKRGSTAAMVEALHRAVVRVSRTRCL